MAKQPKNGEQPTNSNIAFDATASTSTAVVDESAAVEQTQDLSGIYQFSVKPYSSTDADQHERTHTPHIALPIVWKRDDNGKVRKFTITIGADIEVKPLRCPTSGCNNQFEPEPLLRPAGVTKTYPEEAKWHERFQQSMLCPNCKAKGLDVKGLPVRAAGMVVSGRKVRPTYYLTHEEAVRMREFLGAGRPVEQVEAQRQPDGKNLVVGTGKTKLTPFVRRAVQNGMDRVIYLGKLVVFNETPLPESFSPLGGGANLSAMGATFAQVQALYKRISDIDETISRKKATATQKELDSMFAQRAAAVEQVNALTKQIEAAA